MRRLQKLRIEDKISDTIILVEHPEIVTVGPKARRDGVIIDSSYRTVDIDRGGGITWHGPGQLVVYPIIAWQRWEQSVPGVISLLEAWIIAALEECGISGQRDERMQGVWLDGFKVASVGLAFFRWVSRHGFSINIDTPEGRVEGMAGCGLPRGTTTSIARILERESGNHQQDIVCGNDVSERWEQVGREDGIDNGERLSRVSLEGALLNTLESVLNRKISKTIQISEQKPWII
jgi:lipoate-protein ligase B